IQSDQAPLGVGVQTTQRSRVGMVSGATRRVRIEKPLSGKCRAPQSRTPTRPLQHPLHPHRDLLPRCVTSTVEGSYDSPDPTKSAPTRRRPSATHPTLADPDEGHGYRERVHNKGVHPEKRRQGHAQTAPEIALSSAAGSTRPSPAWWRRHARNPTPGPGTATSVNLARSRRPGQHGEL